MAGNLFALLLIGLVAAGVGVVRVAGRRPTVRSALAGMAVAAAAFLLLAVAIPHHLCRRGAPIQPSAAGAALAGCVVAAIPRKRTAAMIALLFVAAAHGLTLGAIEVIHREPYVANPNWSAELDRKWAKERASITQAMHVIAEEKPGARLEPGWIEDSLAAVAGEPVFVRPTDGAMGGAAPFWHTWLTGIYRIDTVPGGAWCRGGMISNGAAIIERRRRDARD